MASLLPQNNRQVEEGVNPLKIVSLAMSLLLMAAPGACIAQRAPAGGATVRGGGLEVSFDRAGTYKVDDALAHVMLVGKLPDGAKMVRATSGSDAMGTYREIEAGYAHSDRVAAIRLYGARGAVLFLDIHKGADANTAPFPSFQQTPGTLMRFSYRVVNFSPIDFGKLDSQGPWVFFDHDRNTVVSSPADSFLVSELASGSASSKDAMSSGISPVIASLPAGFTHRTLMVFGKGITHTLDAWGEALQNMNRKSPIANDADVVLDRLGYWTDNGAKYYYKFDPSLGYEGTLLAIRDQFKQLGVPLGYMQLDSWWYPKQKGYSAGSDNGALVYRADPTIFPDGLASFHGRLQLPMVTHARWIAENSPYRKEYKMSGNVIIDPKFWNSTAQYLKSGGVVVYEQDWLDKNARPAMNIAEAHEYLKDMAEGMAQQDIGIQYCMPLPGYFMASTQFQNLRTVRTSDDRFKPARYDSFLYTSALAHAVGLWPWSDVFMSSELSNVVVSTLSAGPVGTGDSLGNIDAATLKRVIRMDSVILKPDIPLTPIDSMYLADASSVTSSKMPMIATTQTDFGSATEEYVFSYPRMTDQTTEEVSLSELGISVPVYAWDWQLGKGVLIPADGSLHLHYDKGWDYEVLAPVSKAGVALVGDTSKIVPLARKRFAAVSNTRSVEASVEFARGEDSVVLSGYAEHLPKVSAAVGTTFDLKYDAATHVFSFTLLPGKRQIAKVHIR